MSRNEHLRDLPLEEQVSSMRTKLRTDKLDLSFGELASMYEGEELVVNPNYQRLFRWSKAQKTSFIETILLGIPTPAIFVAETDDAVWELVDGLQRVSTVLEFMGVLKDPEGTVKRPLRLRDSENAALPGLGGVTFARLPLRLRLSVKRAGCRVEVIRVGSGNRMKYDLFERLNTGGTALTPQEIRNCVFRADPDNDFMDWIDSLALKNPFQASLRLSKMKRQSQYDRGLVLRFFALKNSVENFKHDVELFITEYVHGVMDGTFPFDREHEEAVFEESVSLVVGALGSDAWRHHGEANQFSPYIFEALMLGAVSDLDFVRHLTHGELKRRLELVKEDPLFLDATGPGGNTKKRLLQRINAAAQVVKQGEIHSGLHVQAEAVEE